MKHIIFFLSSVFLLSSCNKNQEVSSRTQYDSLLTIISERDESITNFIMSFNDVERNIDSITMKQQIISLYSAKSGEFSQSQKAKINNEINAINMLMNKNIAKLDALTKKYKASSNKNIALQQTLKTLTNQLAQKQNELITLNKTLVRLNAQVEMLQTSVDFLVTENAIQSDIIEYGSEILQTSYYIIGKTKMLLDAKIIDKKGGLLNIGRVTEINKDLDKGKFIEIDNTQKNFFPINSTGVKVITSHPSKSFILETDINDDNKVTNLVIIDPPLFWSLSNYLVVATK